MAGFLVFGTIISEITIMITFYDNSDSKGLVTLNEWKNTCWTNVTEPTQADLDYLTTNLNVPIDFLNDIEDTEERPRLEYEDGWLLVIMRIPVKSDHDLEFSTAPLGIIFQDKMTVSICFYQNEVIPDFVMFTQRKGILIDSNINFLLRLILSASVWYQKYLKHINIRTKMVEQELEKSIKNDELQKLFSIEKVLVHFMTSLKGNDLLVYKLKNYFNKEDCDEELLEDVGIEVKQAISTTGVHSDILTSMMDAYASIINNNVQGIMQKLAAITIIVSLPNIISGLFGMNVPNMLERSPFAFSGIIVSIIIVAAVVLLLFKKNRFL